MIKKLKIQNYIYWSSSSVVIVLLHKALFYYNFEIFEHFMKILTFFWIFWIFNFFIILKFYVIKQLLHLNLINIYRIKGILFSILSLSGPSSGEPDTRLVIGTSRTVGSAKKFVRITSGFGGGEFTKTLRKVCRCQKLKFSFLLCIRNVLYQNRSPQAGKRENWQLVDISRLQFTSDESEFIPDYI
jgi:hypothetical protein